MKRPGISVILPVYNVEAWLGECIDSLKAQTFTELEFIFVDDCSPDGSAAVIEAFAREDDRVKLIRQKVNGGQGTARNDAINIAQGEYFSFADPDDFVAPDFYGKLYEKAVKTGAPVVKGKTVGFDTDTGETVKWWSERNNRIRKKLSAGFPLYCAFSYDHLSAVFSRDMFLEGNVRFGTSRNAEDTTFLLRALYGTNEIAFEDRALYYYRLNREQAATAIVTPARIRNEMISLEEKMTFLRSKEQDMFIYRYAAERVKQCMVSFCFAAASNPEVREGEEDYINDLTRLICLLPEYVNLKNLSDEIRILLDHKGLVQPLKENFHRERIRRWTDFLFGHRDVKLRNINCYSLVLLQALRCYLRREDCDLRRTGFMKTVWPQVKRLGAGYGVCLLGSLVYTALKSLMITAAGTAVGRFRNKRSK